MTWRERISEARARGAFSDDDKACGGSWYTCAVGEQSHAPAGKEAVEYAVRMADPLDHADENFVGMKFMRAVQRHDFDAAESLLDEIEDRALELKREAGR